MKISVQWLKDYVAVSGTPAALADKLTMAGLEVEKVATVGNDTVYELEITPNRPDCLNMLGIAREVGAIYNKAVKFPKNSARATPKKKCNVTIEDKKGCSRYIATLISDVAVAAAPRDMQKRLTAVGVRCINNVVDITNFCLMEMGQPMHAFDYDRLAGGKVVVRRARSGEKIVAIDEVEYKLDPSILVIADEKGPVAIAGIMGGKATEVTEKTKTVLLESAYFDPMLIRRAARTLGLASDSSYRFERGVDMPSVQRGAQRCAALMCTHTGGRVTAATDVYRAKQKAAPRTVRITADEIERLLGTAVSLTRCKNILSKLGFGVAAKGTALIVRVPSFRQDVKQPVDIIEEVARIVGYDAIAVTLPHGRAATISDDNARLYRGRLAQALCAQGLHEAITYSLVSAQALEKTALDVAKTVTVQNSVTSEQAVMRPSLLPSMLPVVALNLNKGQKDIALFELGKIYCPDGEQEALGIMMTGSRRNDWRTPAAAQADFYDIKGAVEAACAALGVDEIRVEAQTAPYAEEGSCAQIFIAGKPAGIICALDPALLGRWDIKQKNIFYAQLDCRCLYDHARTHARYQPLADFPAIVRDISIAVKDTVTYQQVEDIIRREGAPLLTAVQFLECYTGEKIPAGQRGFVCSLSYRSHERTLREEEVAVVHDKICQALTVQLGAVKR